MTRKNTKREQLVSAANDLFYRQGFRRTTLADIARTSGVPLGNVYYYFKTKDDLGTAVIEARRCELERRRYQWEKPASPRERLLAFLRMPEELADRVAHHGCPLGSLLQELHKQPGGLTAKADALLEHQIEWITRQFRDMGETQPREQALHLIAVLQGAGLLANAFNDPDILRREARRLRDWVRSLDGEAAFALFKPLPHTGASGHERPQRPQPRDPVTGDGGHP